ncbi:FAD-dependent oxidoreductase [Alicyclobacillus sp. SO9]|uniref:FAD-dependent oxidoreductase n=1 Tax=Alicyclobacillus sp. SO9 TaxID=2665646 RepID=UPI0018E8794B|nr:FAD-dependent oxidoreductase [Alicyclobacillus sp. SO9]QQE81446.1 FAD-dependent oxidoreductase [Alicyclobacillus sp. SO9]
MPALPYWLDSVELPTFPSLHHDTEVDVAIVGGGITGITAAYLLANEGLDVALLEADTLSNGTTGHTTAKLTAQHGLIYDELMQHMGKEKAKLYYESNIEALEFIRQTVESEQIECDFTEEDAYVFASSDKQAVKVEQEWYAYRRLGIDGNLVQDIPLDIDVHNAIVMNHQAQFHPVKYLLHLVEDIVNQGGRIYEGTVAVNVEDGDRPVVVTRNGYRVSAKKVLSCSHFPFHGGKGFYFTRMHADRAYVVAVKTRTGYPGGMYISAEVPTRSVRSIQIGNKEMVLVVGETHKAGQSLDTTSHYEALERFAKNTLDAEQVVYRWSTQDLSTLDKVPYIGELSSGNSNVLVATGFRKWGMTTGTTAALLLSDIVLDKPNPYRELYSPSRFYPDPSLRTFLSENANVAAHLIKGKFNFPQTEVQDVASGHGSVITFNGKRAGAYREKDGTLYVVDTTCTHLGCEVVWNDADSSWDCPCHGSRFTYDGQVMEGPARAPLETLWRESAETRNKNHKH